MNTVDDLAHELWAIAQGRAPISDVVDVMTPTLRAALSAEYERGRSERYTGTPKSDPDYAHSEASQREQDAEPVAWVVYDIKYGGSVSLHLNEFHCNSGDESQFRAVPLYAAPPKHKPLDDRAIYDLWIRRPSIHNGDLELQLRDFARAVEKAHGIGDE